MSVDPNENERLVQQSVEIARLAGSLAHEIKNPLSVIRMNMDLLAEDLADAESPRDKRALAKVETVKKQCRRLQNLLDDFLGYARAQKLQLRPTDLNQQIEELLDFLRPQFAESKIEVTRHLANDLPRVLVDRQKFHGALLNLLLNAQQAMSDGGQLWVQTRETPGTVAIDLIDTGDGISEDSLLHIFEPFFTTKSGGSGLGLTTTRRIIEGHNGTIAVQSKLGRGTQFIVELPLPPRLGRTDETIKETP